MAPDKLTTEYKCRSTISFFVGTVTQAVILPSHIPWIEQGGGILLLHYSMICLVVLPFLFLMGGTRTDHLLFWQTYYYHAHGFHRR